MDHGNFALTSTEQRLQWIKDSDLTYNVGVVSRFMQK